MTLPTWPCEPRYFMTNAAQALPLARTPASKFSSVAGGFGLPEPEARGDKQSPPSHFVLTSHTNHLGDGFDGHGKCRGPQKARCGDPPRKKNTIRDRREEQARQDTWHPRRLCCEASNGRNKKQRTKKKKQTSTSGAIHPPASDATSFVARFPRRARLTGSEIDRPPKSRN